MEIEVKYQIDNEENIEKIFEDSHVLQIRDERTEEELEMHAVYFDTQDRRLYREGIAFRVRKEGDALVATLKWNGSSEEGMHKREEINVPVDSEEKLSAPDIKIFSQSEMCQVLEKIVGDRKLIPLMDIYYRRRQVRLDTGNCICELSVDKGEVVCNGKIAPISELEIELYSGDEEEIIKLGTELCEKYQLSPGEISKYKRGLDLM